MLKAVIFDMDNTLFDVRTASAAAADVVSLIADKPFDLHFLPMNSYNTRRVRLSLAQFFGAEDESDPLLDEYAWLYKTLEQLCIAEFSGMREVLEHLKAAGLKLGILSNTDSDGVIKRLDELGYTRYFDSILCRDEVPALKPDPAAFSAILALLEIAPDEVVMVGDRLDNDVLGARACGMHAIHAWYGAVTKKDEMMCAEKPADILRLLGI